MEESCKPYKIILTLENKTGFESVMLDVFLYDEETVRLRKNLDRAIERLSRNNSSIGVSFYVRGKELEEIAYGYSGVVGISHNLPNLEIILE